MGDKKKWIIAILMFIPVLTLGSFYLSPTAHAIDEGGDLTPWDILDREQGAEGQEWRDQSEDQSSGGSGGGGTEGTKVREQEEAEMVEEVDKEREEKEENVVEYTGKSIDSGIKEYEDSLSKIKESYSEIEAEILRLEEVKAELEGRRAQELGSMEKFEELEKQIAELKEIAGQKQKFPLYPIITTNLVAVLLVFVFSKGRERKYQVERKW